MLDPKATFDDLIARLSPDDQTREDVLGNRIYQQLSSAVAGSQEFTAVAKLYDLHHDGQFDVLVLDTPPSRNALDFLDAPDRLTQFFEGRALQALLRPGNVGMRLLGRPAGMAMSVLKRLTGVDHVVHLAALYDMTADDERNRQVNVEGTRRVVELAGAVGAKRFHHVSSVAVAGEHGVDGAAAGPHTDRASELTAIERTALSDDTQRAAGADDVHRP